MLTTRVGLLRTNRKNTTIKDWGVAAVLETAEKLREHIATSPFNNLVYIPMSVSIGVADASEPGSNWESTLDRACIENFEEAKAYKYNRELQVAPCPAFKLEALSQFIKNLSASRNITARTFLASSTFSRVHSRLASPRASVHFSKEERGDNVPVASAFC